MVQTRRTRCILNSKTRRCNKSDKHNETSDQCVFFRKTDRCRSLKKQDVVDFYNYKVNKSVKTYLVNSIIKKSGKNLLERASIEENYLPTNKLKDVKTLKDYLVNEVLELAQHDALDEDGSKYISLKNVKRVIKNDEVLNMVIFNKTT
jgi:hypothetical protein